MTHDAPLAPLPSRRMLIAAFLAVYLIWGSTYLAIRVAVETLPPFTLAAVRFLFAGLTFYVVLRMFQVPSPTGLQWKNAFIAGNLLLVGGNGLVVWAEQTVPSGRAALVVATTPAWFALLEWLRPGGTRPKAQTVIGIAVGFAGVILLMSHTSSGVVGGPGQMAGLLAVVAATATWAGGSLYGKYNEKPASPWMSVAIQMIAGGCGLLFVAIFLREPTRIQWNRISAHSLWALAYLVVFGSWVGLTAYVWLVKSTTPARLSTYAYVNPVIAVFLGCIVLHEPITSRTLVAAGVIVAGVVIITLPDTLVRRPIKRPVVKMVGACDL